LLDKADLVFIDPVGTGFSHALGKAQDKDFWGVDPDVRSLAQFISTYVSRNNRWNSPKFLIGESYGTFRSIALGNYLQSQDGMYINGIVLISNVLDLSTLSFRTGDDMTYIFYLPTYAAAAWYYKALPDRPADLNTFLNDARHFASTEYAQALMKGSSLTDAEKSEIAKKLAHFTGLSEDFLVKADIRVTLQQFNAELQRSKGLTIGR
jgi:carboxypeptidase C (cathepsin A)